MKRKVWSHLSDNQKSFIIIIIIIIIIITSFLHVFYIFK